MRHEMPLYRGTWSHFCGGSYCPIFCYVICFIFNIDDRIISPRGEVWTHNTFLTPPLFYCAWSKPGKWAIMYLCAGDIDLVLYTILKFYFRIAQADLVCFFIFHFIIVQSRISLAKYTIIKIKHTTVITFIWCKMVITYNKWYISKYIQIEMVFYKYT